MYKVAQLSQSNADLNDCQTIYRESRNLYRKSIQTKKYAYDQRKINSPNGDMERTWRAQNLLLGKVNNSGFRTKEIK